jgi:hypothetical protein
MDIVDRAIHPVVFQKSDFHRNSDFQIAKNRPFTNSSNKNIRPNYVSLLRYFGARN